MPWTNPKLEAPWRLLTWPSLPRWVVVVLGIPPTASSGWVHGIGRQKSMALAPSASQLAPQISRDATRGVFGVDWIYVFFWVITVGYIKLVIKLVIN